MGKADTDVAFSSLLSITATLSSLKAAWWVWRWSQCLKATAKTHTSSIGNLWPFAQLMSTNTEPNPQCKHNGFPVFSGGHLGHLLFCTFTESNSRIDDNLEICFNMSHDDNYKVNICRCPEVLSHWTWTVLLPDEHSLDL